MPYSLLAIGAIIYELLWSFSSEGNHRNNKYMGQRNCSQLLISLQIVGEKLMYTSDEYGERCRFDGFF